MRKHPIVIVAVLLSSLTTHAQEQKTLREAYLEAQVVVLARIVEGRIERVDDVACGTSFTVELLDVLKGSSSKGNTIRFSHPAQLTIGRTYLLFLSDRAEVRVPEELAAYVVPLPQVCRERLPGLVPAYDSGVVAGNETRSMLDIPAELDFDFFWDLEVPFRIVRLDSPYGVAAVKRTNLADVLSVLRQ